VSFVLVACGGGDDDSADTTAAATTTTESTEAPTTTRKATTTTEEASTTTAVPKPVSPLTGLEPFDPTTLDRPALVVKIDNHPVARPQTGLNQADLVFEENVENLTRFAVVFQSADSDPVGPIRSGRTQDIDLLGSLNRPLFAWSGGNGRVTAAVRASDLIDVGASRNYQAGGYFRSERPGPHDLYATTPRLFALAPADAAAPPPQFTYRPLGEDSSQGEPADGVRLSMDGVKVQWLWSADDELYLRWQDGKEHITLPEEQVTSANIVVLYVDYRRSAADAGSPEAVTVGEGEAWVFTDGRWVPGRWTRPDRLVPFTLTAADGEVIELTPGRTWVELAGKGEGAVIPQGADPNSVPYP
jgi:hypothetical protein